MFLVALNFILIYNCILKYNMLSKCFPFSTGIWCCLEYHKKRSVSILDILDDVSQERVQEGLDLIRADGVRVHSDVDRLAIELMYIKDIVGPRTYYQNKEDRLLRLRCFIHPKSAFAEAGARRQVLALLAPCGDSTSVQIPTNVQTFEAALKILHRWDDANEAYIFTRDHKAAQDTDVLKSRLCSGLCSIQGVAMLRHYLKVIYTPLCQNTMLNATIYIRNKLSTDNLRRYFGGSRGLCSRTMLNDFLDEGSEVLEIPTECISRETFEKYGPGLLCMFEIYDDFYKEGVLSYVGCPMGRFIGYHCMVVLGVRMEGQSRMFLLQNWWRDKQFVEVSDEYLESMDCSICFVATPQTFVRDCLPSYADKFVNNELVDIHDAFVDGITGNRISRPVGKRRVF